MGLALIQPGVFFSFPYFFQMYLMLTGFQTDDSVKGTERYYLRLFLHVLIPQDEPSYSFLCSTSNLIFLGSILPMLGEDGEGIWGYSTF